MENMVWKVSKDLRDSFVAARKKRVKADKRALARGMFVQERAEAARVRDGKLKHRCMAEAARPETGVLRERRALERMDPDTSFEGAAGARHGPRRVLAWSASQGRFVTWSYDAMSGRWVPAGVPAAAALRLRVELRKANRGASVEAVCAALEREADSE